MFRIENNAIRNTLSSKGTPAFPLNKATGIKNPPNRKYAIAENIAYPFGKTTAATMLPAPNSPKFPNTPVSCSLTPATAPLVPVAAEALRPQVGLLPCTNCRKTLE